MTLDTISRNRSFWWDRARCAHADAPVLEAVIFDFDAPLAATERDAHMFRDLIWSLHCGDIRVGDHRRRVAASGSSRWCGS